MQRRQFLNFASTAFGLSVCANLISDEPTATNLRVMTVLGELPADGLGPMLPHEHVLVDFIGADKVTPQRYDAEEAFQVMLPYLMQVRKSGCQTMAECTPAFLGRDPKLLKRLSEASGIRLITNTGYYGAGQGKFLPRHAFDETADALARRWIQESKNGIGDTGIRPGFIKTGVDAGDLSEINRKIVQAAARCHLETGLTIAGHTGDGKAASQQVEILIREGVSPEAWIWVHAQTEKDPATHMRIAERGAWVEFDGISPESLEQHIELVQNLKRARLLHRVLISHDAGWYSVGEPRGGKVRGFETLYTHFIPALKNAGFTPEDIHILTVANPANAFAIRKRGSR